MRTQNTISFKTICEAWEMGDPETFLKLPKPFCLTVEGELQGCGFIAPPVAVWLCVVEGASLPLSIL